MDDPVADAVRDSVIGDVSAVERLENVADERMLAAARSLSPLVLTRAALTRVLRDLRDRDISTGQAQRWASFMRRGYLSRAGSAAIRPIEIDYEDEIAIVDPLSRLDELGDVIDGLMSDDELDLWVARLSD